MVWFTDSGDGRIHVSASIQPELEQTAEEEATGTPAQTLALNAISVAGNQSQLSTTDPEA
jgi:hypothetical protein